MTRIGILGADGRMGRAIREEIEGAGLTCSGGIGRGGDAEALARTSDVLVDFSVPDALEGHLKAARAAGVPLLIGTTGLADAQLAAIDAATADIAVLRAANTSLGVNLLAHVVRETARRLGPEWDIEIVEMHHRHKQDAPSGTGLLLAEAAAEGRGVVLADVVERGRDGMGARQEGRIGLAALRGGSVAGDHQVIFAGEGERLEFGHRAESRAIFAKGAVRAALWLAGRPAGRYTMADMLGLS